MHPRRRSQSLVSQRPNQHEIFSEAHSKNLIFELEKMVESEPKREYKRDANGKRVGRPRPLPAHVNARNLAIEKQRRQSLNEKFLVRLHDCMFI